MSWSVLFVKENTKNELNTWYGDMATDLLRTRENFPIIYSDTLHLLTRNTRGVQNNEALRGEHKTKKSGSTKRKLGRL